MDDMLSCMCYTLCPNLGLGEISNYTTVCVCVIRNIVCKVFL